MGELYFTIAGCSHYFGSDFMKKGMEVSLWVLAGCMTRLEIRQKGKAVFVVDGGVVCRIINTGKD